MPIALRYWVAAAIVAAPALLWPLNPDWNNPAYIGPMTVLMITILLVAGLNLLAGQAGQISLGHGALYAAGAYCSAILTLKAGLPFPVAFLASILFGGALGLVLGFPAIRLRGPYLALVTLAFGGIIALLVLGGGRLTGGTGGLRDIPAASIGPLTLEDLPYYYFTLVIAALGVLLARNLTWARPGRALRALRDSELGAEACGIGAARLRVTAFALSAAYAGAAGSLFAHSGAVGSRLVDPSSFFLTDDPAKYSFLFLAALIIGGLGTVVGGVVLGAFLLFIASLFLGDLAGWETTGLGLLLILFLVVVPDGVAGRFRRSRLSALLPPLPRVWLQTLPARVVESTPAAPRTGAALSLQGIGKHFGGVAALHDCSIEVVPASVHALIGPNGAGKTTLFNVLSGIMRADGGRALLDGEDLLRHAPHARAGLGVCRTFQNLQLFASMPAITNVAIGSHARFHSGMLAGALALPRSRAEDRAAMEAAYETMRRLKIESLYLRRAAELSYGQQKMLELARALAGEPRLLLLDEPTTGISQAWVENIVEAVIEARQAGITILLIEHRMDVVARLADTVTVLDYGERIAEGTLEQVRDDPRVVAAYLGEPEEAA